MGWKKSSRCSSVSCVEVRRSERYIMVRDSKEPGIAPLRYSAQEWADFIVAVKDGEFDDLLDESPGVN